MDSFIKSTLLIGFSAFIFGGCAHTGTRSDAVSEDIEGQAPLEVQAQGQAQQEIDRLGNPKEITVGGVKLEHVDLKPLDLISFPPGASRRFMNVTKGPKNRESVLMFVIGGDAPRAEFTAESMTILAKAGVLDGKAPRAAKAKPKAATKPATKRKK